MFNPGLQPNPLDSRDLWLDQLVGGEVEVPQEFLIGGLEFEPQGAYPFCAAFATTKLIETKDEFLEGFSQPDLFFKSGGTKSGTHFRAVLEAARLRGLIDYEELPMPEDIWGLEDWDDIKTASSLTEGKFRISGYARVLSDSTSLKKAILEHGPLLVGVDCGGSYYWDYRAKRRHEADNHAVLLVGWAPGGWWVFDSLQPETGFSGYHLLDETYAFYNVWAVLKLPDNWKELRDKANQNEFQFCLDHYGKPRNFKAEQEAAAELTREFRKFNNQSVWEAAGRFWTIYVNAVCYGGYNSHYRKWGLWRPGDVVNDCYNWRRTGKHIFNFNKFRSEHK